MLIYRFACLGFTASPHGGPCRKGLRSWLYPKGRLAELSPMLAVLQTTAAPPPPAPSALSAERSSCPTACAPAAATTRTARCSRSSKLLSQQHNDLERSRRPGPPAPLVFPLPSAKPLPCGFARPAGCGYPVGACVGIAQACGGLSARGSVCDTPERKPSWRWSSLS